MKTPHTFYTAKGYRVEDSIGYLLRTLTQQLSQTVENRMAVHGMTDAQWKPLLFIQQGKATTAAELARTTCGDTGATTRLVDRIESKGLIQRVRSEADRRIVNLALTAEGEKIAAVIPEVLSEVLNGMLAGFTTDEYEQFKKLVHKALDNLNSADEKDATS